MKKLAEYFAESEQGSIRPQVGDTVDIHINEELAIEAGVLESTEDKLVLEYDERGISLLEALDLVEGFTPDSFEGYVTNFEFTGDDGETQNGTLYFTANVEDGQVVVDPKSLRGESDPDYIAKVDDESATLVVQPGQIDHEYALEAAQEEAEVIWSMRDDKYAHGESVEHIDEEELDELDEGAMKNVVTDIEDAMGPTKIRYKLKQKGGKFIVSVDSNDEEDAQKALKMHPLYVAGKLRVVPEDTVEEAHEKKCDDCGKPISKCECDDHDHKEEMDESKSSAIAEAVSQVEARLLKEYTEFKEMQAHQGIPGADEVLGKKPNQMLKKAAMDVHMTKSGNREMAKRLKEEPNEGNEFSGALAQAKKDGKEEFEVDGKTFKVQKEGFEPHEKVGTKKKTKHGTLEKTKDGVKHTRDYKPDYLDLDGDGDKEEPMKKAAKDAKKKKS